MSLQRMSLEKMKSFSEKIDDQLQQLRIERPKSPQYILHLYADFVELIVLFSKEEVSISDISDLLIDVKDSNIINTEIDDLEISEIASLTSEKDDIIDKRIKSIFEVCIERGNLFKDEYPFFLKDNFIKLNKEISDKQKIYLFLLLASNLNYFTLLSNELTNEFELLSFYCLKYFLPHKAKIKSFGKRSDYNGNAIDKILSLSNDLGIKINEGKLRHISSRNTQERGLDIVAWIPFQDRVANMLIFLCQCACGKSWDLKQNDTIFFANYFYFNYNRPIHSMFIPYSLSSINNEFAQADRVLDTLLFDRKRILEQFEETKIFTQFKSFEVVNKCIEKMILIA